MDYFIDQLRDEFKKLEWGQVYSLVEFVLSETSGSQRQYLFTEINRIFSEEGVSYKLAGGQIHQLMTGVEHEEISTAQNIDLQASIHIQRAIESFTRRPKADYPNTIKESINAVESVIKSIAKQQQGTLVSVIPRLGLHPQLQKGIENLYNWTSDEGGIRHGLKDIDREPNEADARFMLVQCSALVNYLKTLNTN